MSPRRLGLLAVVSLLALEGCTRAPRTAAVPVARAGIPARPSGIPRSGLEVIGGMRWAHPSRELRSLAFTVRAVEYRQDSTVVTHSRVTAALPGLYRIERLPVSRRSGSVRNRQRLAVFEGGRRVGQSSHVDLAALVAYDVFAQSIDTSVMWLDSSRVRFGLLRLDTLEGRQAWVVGAAKGDTTAPQFWVDAVEWRVLRVIQRDPEVDDALADMRFTAYTRVRDVPVPTRIAIHRSGRLVRVLEISALATNPAIPSGAFDLGQFRPLER